MFYACLSIFVLLFIMVFCITLAAIDLEAYNFGLYIVLLCIVGTMLACALCIANPNACPNPIWYSNLCFMLQEMHPAQPGDTSPKMNALRTRLTAYYAAQQASTENPQLSATGDGDPKMPLRQESRATVTMLAPAIHIMHQVWRGMAWVAEGIDEEEEDITKTNDIGDDQGASISESQLSEPTTLKRLSTILESSCSVVLEHEGEDEEIASEFTSSHDIMV